MNKVNAYVLRVLCKPYLEFGYWWVRVKYNAYGVKDTTNISFKSKSAALNVGIGYEFDI